MPATHVYPVANLDSQPFWEGLCRHEVLYQWCEHCQRPVFHPRAACPYCWGTPLLWKQSKGTGRIYSFSETWPVRGGACQIFAIVEFSEGFFMFGELEESGLTLAIGAPVVASFNDLAPDLTLVKFQLVEPA